MPTPLILTLVSKGASHCNSIRPNLSLGSCGTRQLRMNCGSNWLVKLVLCRFLDCHPPVEYRCSGFYHQSPVPLASSELVGRILHHRPQELAKPISIGQPGGCYSRNRAITLSRLFYLMAPSLGLSVAALAHFSRHAETRSHCQEQAHHSLPAQESA